MYLCLPVVRCLARCWNAKEKNYVVSNRIMKMYELYTISDFSLSTLTARRNMIRGGNMLNNYRDYTTSRH